MTDTSEKFLTMMLEGYQNNLQSVGQFIEQTETQLKEASSSRDEMLAHVEELKTLLSIEEETEEETEEATADAE